MKVRTERLLLIACAVWSIAGANILIIGVEAYPSYLSGLNLLLSAAVFFAFQHFVFGRLVEKHNVRIMGYSEKYQFFLKFFDLKSFIIMAIMMSGGIYLRASGAVPEEFIAVFYSGLGASLLLAGLLFGQNFVKAIRS